MVRDGYKETELGEIPVDWKISELRLIVENTEQITPERTPNKIFKYIDVSSISRDLLKIKSYSEFIGMFAPGRARKQIKVNDIIFSTLRPYLEGVSTSWTHLTSYIPDIISQRFNFFIHIITKFFYQQSNIPVCKRPVVLRNNGSIH